MTNGPLNPAKDNEILFIGSKTNLIAYGNLIFSLLNRC